MFCAGIFNLGPTELIVIFLIVLLLFGPKKLPEMGRSFGQMLSNFRKGTTESGDESDTKQAKQEETDKN